MSRAPRNAVPTKAITVALPEPHLAALRAEAELMYGDQGQYGRVLRTAVRHELQRLGRIEADPQLSLRPRVQCPAIGGRR